MKIIMQGHKCDNKGKHRIPQAPKGEGHGPSLLGGEKSGGRCQSGVLGDGPPWSNPYWMSKSWVG